MTFIRFSKCDAAHLISAAGRCAPLRNTHGAVAVAAAAAVIPTPAPRQTSGDTRALILLFARAHASAGALARGRRPARVWRAAARSPPPGAFFGAGCAEHGA